VGFGPLGFTAIVAPPSKTLIVDVAAWQTFVNDVVRNVCALPRWLVCLVIKGSALVLPPEQKHFSLTVNNKHISAFCYTRFSILHFYDV
jgi:hypothetical protein